MKNNMDLSINLNADQILYIRVAAFVKVGDGYLFEKSPDGYFYPIGGKIKFKESSEEALIREVKEEIDLEVTDFKLIGLIENFYSIKGVAFHEICFVYEVYDSFDKPLPKNMVIINFDDLDKFTIFPEATLPMIKNRDKSLQHIIYRK